MTRRTNRALVGAALAWPLFLAGALLPAEEPAQAKKAVAPAAEAKGDLLPWLSSLADGVRQAKRRQQPILVRVGTESCGWCRKLDKELARPDVQRELGRWALVSLNADKLGRDGKALAVGAVPALRLLSPVGRVMAMRNGYLPADQLVAWLKAHYEKTAALPPDELTTDGAPPPAAVTRLVGDLKNRDPALREAAIRRLLPYAVLAAPAIADEFARGNLQSRLAALELLREWKAPVHDLDPWKPASLTAGRLQALAQWATDPKNATADLAKLTPAQLVAARGDLSRLGQAADVEAVAIRERLARHGAALLPEVYARLKDASTDREKERLTALRYRLAASNALALGWPGGLEQMASTTAARRHQAVQELVARATPADEALLLELFSNADPFVRELSLRGLHKIAGREAATALTRLLADPEPNVRAAVLKQLAEKPTAALIPRIRGYLAKEKDTDLVVHAVRVLRAIPGQAAIASLQGLLKHESWRVRAEAAEGIGQYLKAHRYDSDTSPRAEICRALIDALQDEDGFVVGRALTGLKEVDLPITVDPVVATARKHPELAADAVKVLGSGSNMRSASIAHFRAFCVHPAADVRAAAITQLCNAVEDPATELRAALRDKASAVRSAAAAALFQLLETQRTASQEARGAPPPAMKAPAPSGGLLDRIGRLLGGKKPAAKEKPKEKKDDPYAELDTRLEKLRAGEGRPKWMAGLVELLLPMLAAEEVEERLSAALPLVAFAREGKAVPVLLAVARKRPDLLVRCAEAFVWLPWAKRLKFFQQLLALKPSSSELSGIIYQMQQPNDKRALPVLWALARRPDLGPEQAGALVNAIRVLSFGKRYYFSTNGRRDIAVADRKTAAAVARPLAEAGPEMQRLIALAVLATAARDEAVAVAERTFADDKSPEELRGDAFRLLLLTRPRTDGLRLAKDGLAHPLPAVRRLALTYLSEEIGEYVRHNHIGLDVENREYFHSSGPSAGNPWQPAVPKGLKPGAVQPLLRDADPKVAARAGYLLALLGDAEGLPLLVRYWREQAHDDEDWARLVYRAIASLGDDNQQPLLEEIYRGFDTGTFNRISDFYWTIRIIDGPNTLKFRKRIRKEVGMDRLN